MLFGKFSNFFYDCFQRFYWSFKKHSFSFQSHVRFLLVAYESKLVFEMSITYLLQLIACNVHRLNNGIHFIEGSDLKCTGRHCFKTCIFVPGAIQFKWPLSNVNMYAKITKTEGWVRFDSIIINITRYNQWM